MHGAGNDFVVVDGLKYPDLNFPEFAKAVCERRFSVGADGLVVNAKPETSDARMLYFNADGGQTVCGNGMRCLAKMLFDEQENFKCLDSIQIETDEGISTIEKTKNPNLFRANMGKAEFLAENIPTLRQWFSVKT